MTARVPFSNCWWVTENLLAGPTFFSGDLTTDVRKLAALESVGISTIVSLVGLNDYYTDETESEIFAWAVVPRFVWMGFDIPDDTAPNKETMKILLQWIDAGLGKNRKVYLHCHSGRGRTGTVVGCWLARHGIALGEAAIDYMAELRESFNLPLPCPETPEQQEMVVHWKFGA
jgi:protein-tyrosine phosphatase